MPIDVSCHSCGKPYRLKDELAGKKFRCKACGEITTADPADAPSTAGPAAPRKRKPASGNPASRRSSRNSGRPKRSDAPPRRKRKKRQPDPFDDDYRDAYADDLLGSSTDDFDNYGDPYDDYADDDTFGAPPRRKKKSSKSKKKSSGLSVGFNINRLNIALVIIGGALIAYGVNEARLAGKAGSEPERISLTDLMAGSNGNIYLTVTDVISSDEYVYEERGRAGSFSKVWIPCHPPNSNNVNFILSSTDAGDEFAANALMNRTSHTGMITNDIRSLGSEEKKLLNSIPGVNAGSALIFEVGRTPSGAGTIIMSCAGGGILGLGGLAWIFLTGTAAPIPTRTRVPAERSSSRPSGRRRRAPKPTLLQSLFSFQGRVNRGTLWFHSLASGVGGFFALLIWGMIATALGDAGPMRVLSLIMFAVLLILLAWIELALQVKRWQDRDKSGMMVLINLIPFIGPVWTFIECGFLPGTPGPNQYGDEP